MRKSLLLLTLLPMLVVPKAAAAESDPEPAFYAEWLMLYGHRSYDNGVQQAGYKVTQTFGFWGNPNPLEHFAGFSFDVSIGWLEAPEDEAGDAGFSVEGRCAFPWLARLGPVWTASLGVGAGIYAYTGDRPGGEDGGAEVFGQAALVGHAGLPVRFAYESSWLDESHEHRALLQTAFGNWTLGGSLTLGSFSEDAYAPYRELGVVFGYAPLGLPQGLEGAAR